MQLYDHCVCIIAFLKFVLTQRALYQICFQLFFFVSLSVSICRC